MTVPYPLIGAILAGGFFVAGLWTGGTDLSKTKQVINEMVGIISDERAEKIALQNEIANLQSVIADLEREINGGGNAKGLRRQLEEARAELAQKEAILAQLEQELDKNYKEVQKANEEINKANKDAEELRKYAEQKLQEVKDN